jgi:sugar phosphate isomerase/epimerase
MTISPDDRIGIEFITGLGMDPVAFVHAVADLGCRHCGIALAPIVTIDDGARWSLRSDAALRRATADALAGRGVSLSVAVGFLIWPDKDIRETAGDLDLLAELGARRVNILSLDPDRARSFDQFGAFAEIAAARGMTTVVEFVPGMTVGDLATAVTAVRHVARPDFGVLIDAMHLFRTGSGAADVAALDPALIGYVQLCDVPLVSTHASYADEARYDRRAPGDGELPLSGLVAAIPAGMLLGLELPMRDRALAGLAMAERVAPAVAATRALLADIHA